MNRKVVLHGPSTLTISLPSEWVRKFDIGKGDELQVEEVGSELRISTTKGFNLEEKKVDLKDYKKLGKSRLTSLYRQGYGTMEVQFKDNNYIRTIQATLAKELTGFEIVRQSSNSCTIKDLTGHSKDEFTNTLKSIWVLILDLSKESIEAMVKGDKESLDNISLMDHSINKFTNYCLRLLSTSNKMDHQKSYLHYFLVRSLENLADKYKDMCISYKTSKHKVRSEQLELFLKTNRHLEELFELYYRYEDEKIEKFFAKTEKTLQALTRIDTPTAQYISSICTDIRNLISILVELDS